MYSNKVETLLVNTILNMRKKKLTARSRKRLNILKDHEIASLKSKLELQTKISIAIKLLFMKQLNSLQIN